MSIVLPLDKAVIDGLFAQEGDKRSATLSDGSVVRIEVSGTKVRWTIRSGRGTIPMDRGQGSQGAV